VATDPLKILMIAPTPYFSDRGCHVRILEEARALRDLGHAVHICTYHLGRDMAGIPTSRIPAVPWYHKESAGPSWHKPYLDILLFFKAWQVARHFRPDIVHAHLHEGAFIAAFLKPLLKIPVVFDCQGSLTGELVDHRFVRRGSLLFRVFHALESWINRRADHIVTSASPTVELLRREFGLVPDRITAVVDGVDAGAFVKQVDQSGLARELGLPKDRPVVVFLGAMNAYQGVDLLLGVIRRIAARRADLHFLLMGYPEGDYAEKARNLGLGEVVTFTGRIPYDKAASYLNLGAIAVSPKLSKSEANGKLFNYMACGLPTVVFDTPVNREILGDVGVYVPYGDAEAFACAIEALLDDSERRLRLSRELRERTVAEHSWSRRTEDLSAIYRRLMDR
jgi:glycosyltransferase involved in cell wall biosynthesis